MTNHLQAWKLPFFIASFLIKHGDFHICFSFPEGKCIADGTHTIKMVCKKCKTNKWRVFGCLKHLNYEMEKNYNSALAGSYVISYDKRTFWWPRCKKGWVAGKSTAITHQWLGLVDAMAQSIVRKFSHVDDEFFLNLYQRLVWNSNWSIQEKTTWVLDYYRDLYWRI